MKYFALSICFFIVSCAQSPQFSSQNTPTDENGFGEVTGTSFDLFNAKRPDVFSSPSKIHFNELDLNQLEIDDTRLDFGESWELSEKDINSMKRSFSQQTERTFKEEPGVSLAPTASEADLLAEFTLTKFVPNVPNDKVSIRGPRDKILTRSVGKLYMTAEIKHAETGELLAVIEDAEEVGDSMHLQLHNRANTSREFRLTYSRWLNDLKAVMTEL